ncbi:phosphatase PAP2 family protein [Subsaximicrobium wynnwilliamsii]|uniref:Phosphatase PAP2 family protein n=1 Tax=Subsaximicrobium wynnwilliamsii TaxID=291179 RepID=A0A5C6ZEN1_9FLAO|nr:phosphatase PAP2 family protein [Subsaximicrobium wynnwilliamsii]TXD82773.1 phosphatase PAP2 family protein [Subsaximicrobium wynnwilliamsii]TXD88497.1 phosphatase PAP2 family protein [Subsaximicrobium wynnwilliamsii]TXE02507.1 phosphatase PAP2 family protein [Subsaximicrobium wynnwilliamsii]
MIDQIIQYDQDLFLYLNGLGNVYWDAFWLAYTAKFYWIPAYAILAYLLFKQLSLKAFFLLLVVVALMITFTDQITNVFKHGFERFRPCHEPGVMEVMRLVRDGCGGRFGFFSGHASNTMALAIFIGATLHSKYKFLIYVMVVWALGMGYSRIYVGAHYPMDILCGAIFGAFSGTLFFQLQRFLQKRFQLN